MAPAPPRMTERGHRRPSRCSLATAWPSVGTLLTGDHVAVGSDGHVVRLVRGKDREGIGFSARRERGHTYVVPQDALRPVADGVLDRWLSSTSRSWSGTGTTTRTAPRCR